LTFNTENEVAENLFAFGTSLNHVYRKVMLSSEYGYNLRDRIFKKVRTKLDDEIEDMKERAKKAEEERKQREIDQENKKRAKMVEEIKQKERMEREADESKVR